MQKRRGNLSFLRLPEQFAYFGINTVSMTLMTPFDW
jgi:hypothetical protein